MAVAPILFVIFLLMTIIASMSRTKDTQSDEVSAGDDPDQIEHQRQIERITSQKPGSLLTMARRVRRWFGSRKLEVYEMAIIDSSEPGHMKFRIFGPRKPLYVDLLIAGVSTMIVDDVQFRRAGDTVTDLAGIDYKFEDRLTRCRLYPSRIVEIDEVILRCEFSAQQYEYKFDVTAIAEKTADYDCLKLALQRFMEGQFELAVGHVHEYERMVLDNPSAKCIRANARHALGRAPEAELDAIMAAALGMRDIGTSIYRLIASENPLSKSVDIAMLKSQADNWSLERHYGLVSLLRRTTVTLGIAGYHMIKYQELILVRRPAAARLLRTLTFDYPSSQSLIHSSARVLRDDCEPEELADDFFNVAESSDRNVFIRTASEYTGTWILPDLIPGDIIEWNYDLLCMDIPPIQDDRPHFIVQTSLCRDLTPILESVISCSYPKEMTVKSLANDFGFDIEEKTSVEGGRQALEFRLRECKPPHVIGYPYPNGQCKPNVVFASGVESWRAVANSVISKSSGDLSHIEALPAELEEIVDNATSKVAALRSAFYWIRDKLKYGSFTATELRVGSDDRASAIVASGMADCKDKSYLIVQVCKHLGFEAQYLLVSTENGVLVPDVPCDQFDHVIVRVKIDDDWVYLDASGSYAVFCTPPPPQQGLKALSLDHGQLVDIPIPDPSDNLVMIGEKYDSIESGWLAGTFMLTANGQTARYTDENWKSISMSAGGQQTSTQSLLKTFMNLATVTDHEKLSDTSTSDRLEISGSLLRCKLSEMGDHEVGVLEWSETFLPIQEWRSLHIENHFAFLMPTEIRISLAVTGQLSTRLHQFSVCDNLDNDICSITSHYFEDEETKVLQRTIVVKTKYVGPDLIDQLRPTFEALEAAFRIAVSFKPV